MFQSFSNQLLKTSVKIITGTTFITSFATATYYRPICDRSNEHENDDSNPQRVAKIHGPNRIKNNNE